MQALERQGLTRPTPIQQSVIPAALKGRNVLGRAQTGSGKTLAFGLPLLSLLAGGKARPKHPRALILLPTRELANQVRATLEPLARGLDLSIVNVYGGTSYDRQIKALRRGTDILVATPGRLADLIERGDCRLDEIEVTVLDEADHLCDLGFFKPIDRLLGQTPTDSQRLLLSATLDGEVDRLVKRHIGDPVTFDMDPGETPSASLDHHVVITPQENKKETVYRLAEGNPRSIVFTRTRRGAEALARQMNKRGITAVDLHGDLSQRARERNLAKFARGDASTVVATDVAARGIHIDDISLVVHFDAPAESKAYTHRSGRTARAGKAGTVVTLTTPADVDAVVRLQRQAGVNAECHDAARLPTPLIASELTGTGRPAPAASSSRKHGMGGETRGRSGPSRSRQRRRTPARAR